MTAFSDLMGVTLQAVTGLIVGSDEVTFIADDNRQWNMLHYQDCCEGVAIEEIIGDVADLIGSPILRAEEVVSDAAESPAVYESGTWTFYKLATIKGEVVIRWLGTSNGYYSESVSFTQVGVHRA